METNVLDQVDVRQFVLKRYSDFMGGAFGLPKFQSMDGIDTEYVSTDMDAEEFVKKEFFDFTGISEEQLIEVVNKLEVFSDQLGSTKLYFSENQHIRELEKIIACVKIEIEHLKEKLRKESA